MGSRCEITIEARSESEAALAASRAFHKIRRIERVLSDYDPSSEAMRVMRGQSGTPHAISETLLDVLLLGRDVHNSSDGAFDPSMGAITHAWRSAQVEGGIPTPEVIADARERSGFAHLRLDPDHRTLTFDRAGMILDFGGIGKGYAAWVGVELLRDLGYPVACVDLGGDIQLGDAPSDSPDGWRVEIMSGISRSTTIHLSRCGVATSGDLERYSEHGGVRYSHIIDPRTGYGITERRAVTVIASDAGVADALASALSVLGKEGEAQLNAAYPDAEFIVVNQTETGN